MRFLSVSVAALVACLSFVPPLQAQDRPQFPFVNAQGQIQRTEEPQSAPEPYRSAYAMQRQAAARGNRAPAAPGGVGPADEAAQVEQNRARWQARAAEARVELLRTLDALIGADQALSQAKQNPLLAVTPAGRARVNRAQAIYDATLSNTRAVEHVLLVSLPEEARRAQVPPLWLEP